MAKQSKFWGAVGVIASAPIAIAAGVAKGTHNAVTGNGSFSEGYYKASEPVFEAVGGFTAEHSETITKGLLHGGAAALGGAAVNEAIKHSK